MDENCSWAGAAGEQAGGLAWAGTERRERLPKRFDG
jgi:hypothetical protein